MHASSPFRKIFFGCASRHEVFRLFDRHARAPMDDDRRAGRLHLGEWFELGEAEHDYMFEIPSPLFMRGDMFAMREYLTGSITSIFFTLKIAGRFRWFHGYCDLADKGSLQRMRDAIIERESLPVRAMTRHERIEHIWSATHDDYRGYASERWPEAARGKRIVTVYVGRQGRVLKLLEDLTDDEINGKLPVQLRHLPNAIAA